MLPLRLFSQVSRAFPSVIDSRAGFVVRRGVGRGRHVLMNQLPQRAGLRGRERHELLVERDVLWAVDLPLLGDRPIRRARPIQRQLLRTFGAGQAREERVQVVVSALHASFPQHNEDLSIAGGQRQRAQPSLAHVVSVQGAFEGLPTHDGLQIDRDTLAIGPKSGGGSNEMMRNAHGRRVFRLAQLQPVFTLTKNP